MKPQKANALATIIISFATVIGLMVGLYYNMRTTKTNLFYIIVIELLFVIGLWLLWLRINKGVENE